jgi:hypothetical protein
MPGKLLRAVARVREVLGGKFKRSQRFGIFGVVAVMIASAAIALAFGTEAPQATMAAVLGLVFAYVVALLRLQRADLATAEASTERDLLTPTMPVSDPALADDNSLLAALAVKPVDPVAIATASKAIFAFSRDSIGAVSILMVLIACAVVPWQLFQFIWSIVVFVPIIVVYVLYLAGKALLPGGTMDQAYDVSKPSLDPLGLQVTERPKIRIEPRRASPGLQKKVTGAVAFGGTRHGRHVVVRLESGARATTTLGAATQEFTVKAHGSRLRADGGAPPAVQTALASLAESERWRDVTVTGGPEGVVVERRRSAADNWMRDLWLAERLADAAG